MNNFNQKNFDLMKIMNERDLNIGNINTNYKTEQMQFKRNLQNDDELNLEKLDKKTNSLIIRKEEEIDLYDPKFWQAKVQQNKETTEEAKNGITTHLNNLKGGISKFLSIFTDDELQKNHLFEDVKKPEKIGNNHNKKIIDILAEIKEKNLFLSFHAHKESSVNVLKAYIIEKLIEKSSEKYSHLKNENLLILFKSSILINENILANYEFDSKDKNLINVIFVGENESINDNEYTNNVINELSPLELINDSNKNILKYYRKVGDKTHSQYKSLKLRKKSISPLKENININESNNIKTSKIQTDLCNNSNKMLVDSTNKMDKEKFLNENNYFPSFNGDFDLNPRIEYIYRMKKSELRNLEGFSISNKYGKIKFKTKVDIT